MLMGLLNLSPIFPLYYGGKTKFMPLHCIDICNLILDLIENDTNDKIIECVGPEELTFKQIIEKLLKLIEKKRFFCSNSYIYSKYYGNIFSNFT